VDAETTFPFLGAAGNFRREKRWAGVKPEGFHLRCRTSLQGSRRDCCPPRAHNCKRKPTVGRRPSRTTPQKIPSARKGFFGALQPFQGAAPSELDLQPEGAEQAKELKTGTIRPVLDVGPLQQQRHPSADLVAECAPDLETVVCERRCAFGALGK
jgi:hypothetical protein